MPSRTGSNSRRRTISNVPAQALILLNDPFVVGQADVWAKRTLADKAAEVVKKYGLERMSPTSLENFSLSYGGTSLNGNEWLGLNEMAEGWLRMAVGSQVLCD